MNANNQDKNDAYREELQALIAAAKTPEQKHALQRAFNCGSHSIKKTQGANIDIEDILAQITYLADHGDYLCSVMQADAIDVKAAFNFSCILQGLVCQIGWLADDANCRLDGHDKNLLKGDKWLLPPNTARRRAAG